MFASFCVARPVLGKYTIFQWMKTVQFHDFARIREQFNQYKGGSVDLKLNEETGIAEICLNRPEKKNALTGSMMIDLADAVSKLEQWNEGKGVIFHALGDVFCSGGDLHMVGNICTSHQGLDMATMMHNTTQRLLSLPLISVTLVQGNAIGGGAELTTATDFRLATQKCSFQFLQKRLGVVTGWGGGTRLVRLLGPSKALELLTSCRKVLPEEAMNIGLVSAVLNPEVDALTQTREWLSLLTSGSHQVVRVMKNIVHCASQKNSAESLTEEAKLFSTVWGGYAQKQALKKALQNI